MLFLFVLLLQTGGPPTSVDRVREALNRPAIDFNQPAPDVPVFRVRIRERPPLEPLWKEPAPTPSYVRTKRPVDHHEFLAMVTPEEFRSAALYPCCIDLVPVFDFLHDQAAAATRSFRESRARNAVKKALRENTPPKKN